MSKRVNLRLDVTEEERDLVRRAAALGGYRSMAEFCRTVVLNEATRTNKLAVPTTPDTTPIPAVSNEKDAPFKAS